MTQPQLVTVDGSLSRERVCIFLPGEQKGCVASVSWAQSSAWLTVWN